MEEKVQEGGGRSKRRVEVGEKREEGGRRKMKKGKEKEMEMEMEQGQEQEEEEDAKREEDFINERG